MSYGAAILVIIGGLLVFVGALLSGDKNAPGYVLSIMGAILFIRGVLRK